MATQEPPQTSPTLLINDIKDEYIRKNFQALADYFSAQNQLLNFSFFELEFTAAETGKRLSHGFSYIPLDILVTRITGAGTVTFKYGEFTTTEMVMDVSGACRIRFFAGTYNKQSTSVQTKDADAQVISAS